MTLAAIGPEGSAEKSGISRVMGARYGQGANPLGGIPNFESRCRRRCFRWYNGEPMNDMQQLIERLEWQHAETERLKKKLAQLSANIAAQAESQRLHISERAFESPVQPRPESRSTV
jgi:hypothetical protein